MTVNTCIFCDAVTLPLRWYLSGEEMTAADDGEVLSSPGMSGLLEGEWRVEAQNCHTNIADTTFSISMGNEFCRRKTTAFLEKN